MFFKFVRYLLGLDIPKPSDFFLGAFEFFGVLIPGALLAYAVLMFGAATPLKPYLELAPGGIKGWLVFAVISFILGWAIQPPSHVLNWLYDHTYRKCGRRGGDANYQFAKRKAESAGLPETASVYRWAEVVVESHDQAAAREIKMAQGISKLFRALTLFSLVACGLALYHAAWGWGVSLLISGAVCFLVFAERRWNASAFVYQRFKAIHEQAEQSRTLVLGIPHSNRQGCHDSYDEKRAKEEDRS